LRGKVVTGDAIFTQQGRARQIVQSGGDYLFLVKANQPGLRAALEAWFTPGWAAVQATPRDDFASARTLDKGQGRLEERLRTSRSQLNGQLDWP
jgi:hypothetical protein